MDPHSPRQADAVPLRAGLFEVSPSGEPRLLASRCPACQRMFFPARDRCAGCDEEIATEPVALCGSGVIYASTVVHVPSPAGIQPPYAYGYVEMDAAPLRVFALFTSVDPLELAPGERVDMVVAELRREPDGTQIVSHRFRPRREAGKQ